MADTVEALRLLQAFRGVEDARARQLIIRIVEALGRGAPRADRPEVH
jgi:hypothetical protein